MKISITDYNSCSAAGADIHRLRASLSSQVSGLRSNDLSGSDVPTWIGRVTDIDNVHDLGVWQSRNNVLALIGLASPSAMGDSIQHSIQHLIKQLGRERIGVVIGSSTSSIDRTEMAYTDLSDTKSFKPAYQQPRVHNPHAPGLFVAHHTGIRGPAMTVNTACSSSAKVFATAARWLDAGIVDAVLVGGVDTLCLSVVHGFDSLQLVSASPCKPFDATRDGINLGEASGFAILQRAEDAPASQHTYLTGYGESSDAYHMSHPHPEGEGARLSIAGALAMARLAPQDLDYINLHGTASRANDSIEGKLITSMFGDAVPCSSTKGWMGHTLGAAGITEAIIAFDAMSTGLVPGSLNLQCLDDDVSIDIQAENRILSCQHVMTNSFGFGGNNCSLVFSRGSN